MKSEFNELGQYIMISLCFVIGTLIEFAVVLLIKQVYKEGGKRSDLEQSNHEEEANVIVLLYNDLASCEGAMRSGGLGWFGDGDEQDKNDQTHEKCVGFLKGLSLINKIDYVSFVFMSTLYLIYNFVYFTYAIKISV